VNVRANMGQGGQAPWLEDSLKQYDERGVVLGQKRDDLAAQVVALQEAHSRGEASAEDVETLIRELGVVDAQIRANDVGRRGEVRRAREWTEARRQEFDEAVDHWARAVMGLSTATLPRLDAAIAEVVGLVRQVRETLSVEPLRAWAIDEGQSEHSPLLSGLRAFDPVRVFEELVGRRLATVGLGSGVVSRSTRVEALQPLVEERAAKIIALVKRHGPSNTAEEQEAEA